MENQNVLSLKEILPKFQEILEDSYLIPVGRDCSELEDNYNQLVLETVKCCMKLKLYLKDLQPTK